MASILRSKEVILTILGCVAVLLLLFVASIRTQVVTNSAGGFAAKVHDLGIASFSYANDNNGNYPSGPTSTAIFQQLYDSKYITQPGDVFLTAKGGKSIAEQNPRVLTAANVSYNYVTRSNSGVNDSDPEDLPLLYSCATDEPAWGAGINKVKLDANCPWGTDGVVMCTLSQQASFKRPTSPGEVALTTASFVPAKGVTYVTRSP